jgi:uncharacterized OB-fold protein
VRTSDVSRPHAIEDEPTIVGSRCTDCRRTIHNGTPPCALCGSSAVVAVELARCGRVETWTLVSGTVVGEVRLDDGVLVLARLGTSGPEVGARVTLRRLVGEVAVFGEA